jgi:hypothetical protein
MHDLPPKGGHDRGPCAPLSLLRPLLLLVLVVMMLRCLKAALVQLRHAKGRITGTLMLGVGRMVTVGSIQTRPGRRAPVGEGRGDTAVCDRAPRPDQRAGLLDTEQFVSDPAGGNDSTFWVLAWRAGFDIDGIRGEGPAPVAQRPHDLFRASRKLTLHALCRIRHAYEIRLRHRERYPHQDSATTSNIAVQ